MRKTIIFVATFLLLATQVFAAGSGSGGAFAPDSPAPAIETVIIEPQDLPPAPTPLAISATPVKALEVLCNDIEDMHERIACRLNKDNEGLAKEYSVSYLPEECRPLEGDWQKSCIDKYISLLPCWEKNVGPERIACVKNSLGLPSKIVSPKSYCSNDKDPAACMTAYRKNVYSLITFRFYDAEERVEHWYEEGKISFDDTVDFIAFIAQSKVAFYQSETKDARQSIIETVMEEWAKVVEKVQSSNTK